MRRILPPTLVAATLVAMIGLTVIVPWPDAGLPIRAAGVCLATAGLAITVRHAKLFDQIGTNVRTFDDPDTLVLQGAFTWTRNPMYVGFLLLLIGAALVLGAGISLLGPVFFFGAADRWYIPFEERRMAVVFGVDYDDYQRAVHRWIGRKKS